METDIPLCHAPRQQSTVWLRAGIWDSKGQKRAKGNALTLSFIPKKGFEFWKGNGQMIDGGFCAEHGAVSDVLADSIEKCLGTLGRKKLTLASVRYGPHAPLLLLVAVSIALGGCVGGKTTTSANETPTISLSITQAPASPLSVGGKATVAATVSDDAANAGVEWVPIVQGISCTNSANADRCGSFSPAQTASGATTTFTAPKVVPADNIVTLTALSATDKGKAASATVTITSNVAAVAFTQPPPATYPAGGSLNVAAFVAGDPFNEGVDWNATCGGINCTSAGPVGFQSTHSAPGSPATFVIPLPSNPLFPNIVGSTVTLIAVATADHNFSASATFIVISPVSISITQGPPASVLTNASVPVVAVVTNDPTNSGVTWTIVSCDLSPCGSWSAGPFAVLNTQVASGGTATYFAPGTAVNHVRLQAAASASPTTALATAEISVAAPISIAITQGVVNNTIVKNATAQVAAMVSNDPAKAGVDWTVTCGSAGACGSFFPTHTASGTATTFTAPSAVPTPNTVTITAKSTSDQTKTASQILTVTVGVPPPSLLLGQWVMLLTGKDANKGPYSLGGVIAGDGIGTITSGTLDVEDLGSAAGTSGLSYNANTVHVAATQKSTYTIGTDGRGQIHLAIDISTLNSSFGVVDSTTGNGIIVLSVVFVSPKHALLTETDTFGSGTGTLDLQSAGDLAAFRGLSSGLSGSYALKLTGVDLAGSNLPYFLASVVSFRNSSGSYTETSYIADQSDQGVIHSAPQTSITVNFIGAAPSASGEISLLGLNLGVPPTQFNLDLWLIDANHFVVTDTRDLFFVTPSVIISGYMVAQPASTAISGTYAFTEAAKTAPPAFNPQAVGGIFTCGSTGTLDLAPLSGAAVNIPAINAACTAPSSGRGLITISNAGTTGISKFAAYPTLDQGLYLLELDGGSTPPGPSGAGVAMHQTLTPPISVSAFNGKYASNFLANTALGLEAFAGQILSDGVSHLSGTVDVNSFTIAPPPLGAPSLSATLTPSSSFTAAANGRFPLMLFIPPAAGQPPIQVPNINPVCYILDANTCLLLGLDPTAPGTGIFELQNTGL